MSFNDKCYKLLSKIPKGKISTYKEIALVLNTKAYRAVGSAMANNPDPVITPCHRIVKSDGSIGGYAFGTNKKIELLRKEGISIKDDKIENFKKFIYSFKKEKKTWKENRNF